jgi:SAM-dependent methyltransferase
MQPAEYETMHDFERSYWWYRARRKDLIETVRSLPTPVSPHVLDVGCGTGYSLDELVGALSATGFGIDASPHAAALWNGDTLVYRCLASANELPFEDGRFDVVVSADVIGCDGVDAEKALREMARVLRPSGHLVLFAPAYQWMRSRHDRAVHSVRRFTRGHLQRMVLRAGFDILRSTYRFFLFFPMIAVLRLATKPLASRNDLASRSDLRPLPRWINRSLLALASWEMTRLGKLDLPWGSSVMIVARKESADHA